MSVEDREKLRPSAGARYAVELASWDGARAVYRGAVHLADVSYPLEVAVGPSGLEVRVDGPDAVRAAHEKPAGALVKAAAKLPRDPDAGPPPRRVVRWRG